MSAQPLNTNGSIVYLLLGTNLGKRKYQLDKAKGFIENLIGKIQSESSLYETQPWENPDQSSFLNQAIAIKTQLTPDQMLQEIHNIEKQMGRVRKEKNEPRIIDIDILLWGKNVIKGMDLEIPHPRLHLRNFVLVPLMEIAGNEIHPIFKKSIEELYEECEDPLEVYTIN
ncbi:MAG: 2-amino-4-hydroxy-6-hydroxymethyldihydropteridine diphosphokinase [Saprospiraceae bacterium]|nr:2-amino-4-hydroxy-6-hydroxymethyldihydropteridine diphosphokinase [Candidatus Vicinibacter affinis]MBP6174181.1 2-amino-4-hydroxy-6-hydroxymethyldihydropteridine diphosphokinase [Saprospiraceae bacterium]